MKWTRIVMSLLGVALGCVGCGAGAPVHQASSQVTLAPDDFVLRDVRKDAAPYLNCQVPMISTELGPWEGTQGNVTATGCGFHVTYYVACRTAHDCNFSVAE